MNMISNEKVFGRLTKEEQELFKKAGKKNCVYWNSSLEDWIPPREENVVWNKSYIHRLNADKKMDITILPSKHHAKSTISTSTCTFNELKHMHTVEFFEKEKEEYLELDIEWTERGIAVVKMQGKKIFANAHPVGDRVYDRWLLAGYKHHGESYDPNPIRVHKIDKKIQSRARKAVLIKYNHQQFEEAD